MFNSILTENLTLINFVICMGVALVLGFIVALVHATTTKTNKNFINTLTILPMLVTLVILLVNGNLGTSVAVVGAFSLIRFRSIPGNSKEILAVFFAMAIGLAVGTGFVAYATIFTILVSLIMFILDKINLTNIKEKNKVLTIVIPEDLDYTNLFKEEFSKYLDSYELMKAKTTNMGSLFELTYDVSLKNNINEKEFIDKIRVKNGNLKVMLSHPIVMEAL